MANGQAPIQVTLCRYESGNLVKGRAPLSETTEFLAISHVWGKCEWQYIPGLEGDVLVSREKAEFIARQLPSIVGSHYFWMDVLCIDQRNREERIAVTQHIPAIFRIARRTIVVKDDGGLRKCCTEALGDISTWDDDDDRCTLALVQHYASSHQNGGGLTEGLITRLWPLQEILLSDEIQFVSCGNTVLETPGSFAFQSMASAVERFCCDLHSLALSWIHYEQGVAIESENDLLDFLKAFINDGTVYRKSLDRYKPLVPSPNDFTGDLNSTRVTSKPRDFILATMPRYAFYTLPANAKNMTFGQLFVDCFQQLDKYDTIFRPLVPSGMPTQLVDILRRPATEIIPEPHCLGDMVKLFLGPRPQLRIEDLRMQWTTNNVPLQPEPQVSDEMRGTSKSRHLDTEQLTRLYFGPLQGYQVRVQPVAEINMLETLRIIEQCMRNSTMLWKFAEAGEFHELQMGLEALLSEQQDTSGGVWEFETDTQIVLGILKNMYDQTDYFPETGKAAEWALEFASPSYVDSLARLAAQVSCGLGVSAYSWSKEYLTPVVVWLCGRSFLALIPQSISHSRHEFLLVEADEWLGPRRFLLLARAPQGESAVYCMGLFPPDVEIEVNDESQWRENEIS